MKHCGEKLCCCTELMTSVAVTSQTGNWKEAMVVELSWTLHWAVSAAVMMLQWIITG